MKLKDRIILFFHKKNKLKSGAEIRFGFSPKGESLNFIKSSRRYLYLSAWIILVLLIFFGAIVYYKYSLYTIADYVPSEIIFYGHFSNKNSDKKLLDFILTQAQIHLKNDKIVLAEMLAPYLQNQTAIALFKYDNNIIPVLIIETKNNFQNRSKFEGLFETANKKGFNINYWDNKFLVLSKDSKLSDMIKIKNSLPYKKLFKKYRKDDGYKFYINLNNLQNSKLRLIDKTIIDNLEGKKISKILGNIIKVDDVYNFEIKDIKNNKIASGKVFNNFNKGGNFHLPILNNLFIFGIHSKSNISEIWKKDYIQENKLEKNKLSSNDNQLEFILLKNGNAASTLETPENINDLKEFLMLQGGDSDYYWIAKFRNNLQNQDGLEQIKILMRNYLSSKLPEERKVILPDGTDMVELWRNPKKFNFTREFFKSFPVYTLRSDKIGFEFSYAENNEYIFLSNSYKILPYFLEFNNNETTKKKDNFFLKLFNWRWGKDENYNEDFYVNNEFLKGESEIFRELNILGENILGYVIDR